MFAITGNTYPVKDDLRAMGCRWNPERKAWVAATAELAAKAQALVPAAPAPCAPAAVDNIGRVVELMRKAGESLKRPALLVYAGGRSIRLSVAGERSSAPGSINVTSVGDFESREWYGRIMPHGIFEPNRRAGHETATAITAALAALARDPAKAARDYGHMTGVCCFCARPLTDARSTAVGYGPTCADNYGLPWGA